MIRDPGFQHALGRMSGIDSKVTGDAVSDYELLSELREELQKSGECYALLREKANLGLTYLLLFHSSPLVRYEAAFIIGEYSRANSFLHSTALLDQDATVRHEAALALGAYSQRRFAARNKWILEYVATHDRSRMVKDTARVSLKSIEFYL